MKMLVDANNLLSLLTGGARDISGMKDRVKRGYEGEFTDHVHDYDHLGYQYQDKSARHQLEGLSFDSWSVLDVGCGTGALAQVAFEHGAQAVVCGDISHFMLREAKHKEGAGKLKFTLCQLDAESLPYADYSFDAVISGMTFGTLPNQAHVVDEMVRITKPGGLVCIGAHGPEHYWEAIDATLRCINKRYVLGYRFEWWPRTEDEMRELLERSNLHGIHSQRVTWRNKFTDGTAAYDFFAAISSSWWYAKFPPEARLRDSQCTRAYFMKKNIDIITDDIVVAYGYRPAREDP
ncbi:MAG: class I SAM-dependent methyltransferase [Anaerolineales bacterium]